jgi:hypothetical protein
VIWGEINQTHLRRKALTYPNAHVELQIIIESEALQPKTSTNRSQQSIPAAITVRYQTQPGTMR